MYRNYYDMEAFGQELRRIRKERQISVERVREFLQLESTQAIYKWESGKCFPQADTLIALCKFYDVNPMVLFGEAEASPIVILNGYSKKVA